jgi:hypothetical protein
MRVPVTTRKILAAGLAPLLLAALAGCGSDDPAEGSAPVASETASPAEPSEPSASASSEDTPAEAEDPVADDGGHTMETLLPAMKAAVADNRSSHMTMDLLGPQSMSMEGDLRYDGDSPVLRMTLESAAFAGAVAEIRVIGGVMYMSIPPMTPEGKFLRIDPDDPDNPFGPAMSGLTEQVDPLTTFDGFEAGLKNLEYVGEESVSGEAMDHYVLTVDTAKASKAQGQTAMPGMPPTLDYDLWLDDEDLMRKVGFEIPGGASMDMTMSDWGEPVTVEAPAAKDIVEPPSR